jgi:hypothetical protein
MIRKTDDESGRLLSYMISIYEVIFGFIMAGGTLTQNTTISTSLLKAALAFFLAAVGLHFFVNLEKVRDEEFRKKRGKLWIGVIALLLGIAAAVSVGTDAFTNHVFFLLYISYIVISFIYFGLVREIWIAGSVAYGILRIIAVLAGTSIAGKILISDFGTPLLFMLISYACFFVISEYLRWTAASKSTRFSILFGFVLMLALMTYIFYHFTNELGNIQSKLIIMGLVLVLLVLVGFPPLHAIRTMKAKCLLSIFHKSLAGGVILTLIFFMVLQKDLKLLLLIILPALILATQYKSEAMESKDTNEIHT